MYAITLQCKDGSHFEDKSVKHRIEAIAKTIANILDDNNFSYEEPVDTQSKIPTFLIGCDFAKGGVGLTVGSEPDSPTSIFIIMKECMPMFANFRAKSSLLELARLKKTLFASLESDDHFDAVKEELALNVLVRIGKKKEEEDKT